MMMKLNISANVDYTVLLILKIAILTDYLSKNSLGLP